MAMTSTFVENYETEQPILELARFMNLSQQKAAGHDADMGDSELYQECDQLLATQPIQLFHKMFEFVKNNLDLGEADLEGAFHCLFLLLRRLADGEATLAVTNIVTVLSAEASRPTLRLRIMSNLYALLGETGAKASRYTVFMAMMKFASANSLAHMLSGQFDKLDAWVEEWGCTPGQVVDLYWEVTQALFAQGGQEAEATCLLHKVLKAAEAGDAATLSAVSEQAKLACVTAIKDPETFKLDELLDFAAVQQLEASNPLVVALLRVFVHGKLADYTKFVSANGGLLGQLGLDPAECEVKMRLLTLASLANEHEEVPYSVVASDLGIATKGDEWMADIEGCVIQAIAAGLIEARLDQRRQVVIITRSTQRQFQEDDWKQLGDKLASWRDHVQRMLMVIESAAAREL